MSKPIYKKIVWCIAAIALLSFIAMAYISTTYGNLSHYFTAKEEISKYIDQHYKDVLILEKVRYSSKMMAYVGRVKDKNDSSIMSYIAYYANTGDIEDDYRYRIQGRMEDDLRATLTTLISSSCNISAESLQISPLLEIPSFKYRMSDKYTGAEPITLNLSISTKYKSKEDFGNDAYKILRCLDNSNLKFKKINIYSFTPEDGDRAYDILLEVGEKITSLEEVQKRATIKYMGK
ncbi:MAG: hypothetical protein N2484_05775 [Clostridia bacterium]|nr:hypothetical protein [Clostridia bacterium]